jgi:hypothetical protein
MARRHIIFVLLTFLSILAMTDGAIALEREQVIAAASQYADAVWVCTRRNVLPEYNLLTPGKTYKGLPYNYGGADSLEVFQRKILEGVIAGNYRKRCGKMLCTRADLAGLDCSGLVSRCWQIPRYSTIALPNITIRICREDLRPGDILNSPENHVVLFDQFDDEGQMWVFESVAWLKMEGKPPAGVAYRVVDLGEEYTPRRYYKFIRTAERVRTTRPVPVVKKPGARAKRFAPVGSTGTIMDGPQCEQRQGSWEIERVWVYVKYDNGKEGWSPIRYLYVTSDKVQLASESRTTLQK